MTPAQKVLRARMAAYTLHSRVDSRAHMAPARAAFNDRFARIVDPDNLLAEPERNRRAEAAKKAHMAQLAMKSAAVRARKTPRRATTRSANPGSLSNELIANNANASTHANGDRHDAA